MRALAARRLYTHSRGFFSFQHNGQEPQALRAPERASCSPGVRGRAAGACTTTPSEPQALRAPERASCGFGPGECECGWAPVRAAGIKGAGARELRGLTRTQEGAAYGDTILVSTSSLSLMLAWLRLMSAWSRLMSAWPRLISA